MLTAEFGLSVHAEPRPDQIDRVAERLALEAPLRLLKVGRGLPVQPGQDVGVRGHAVDTVVEARVVTPVGVSSAIRALVDASTRIGAGSRRAKTA